MAGLRATDELCFFTTPCALLGDWLVVGLIPKLLLKLIESVGGPDTVAKVLQRADLPPNRHYAMNRVYPCEEWRRLYAATLAVLDIDEGQAEALYAEFFVQDALLRFPKWFEMCRNSYDFLCLQPKIHNVFATGLQSPPERRTFQDKFRTTVAPNRLLTEYRSPNRLCGLYTKLARRIALHYGDEISVEELQCAKGGAECCRIEVTWQELRHA